MTSNEPQRLLLSTNKYTVAMKELNQVREQTDKFQTKLDAQSAQKEAMLLKIIETRAKLELQKDDLRDIGIDPESADLLEALKAKKPTIVKKSIGSLNQNATQMHADLEEDYQNKKAEYIIERLSEIKRWHNSVKNILENRVRDYNRLLEDLDPRYREIRENYKQKRALVRERRLVLKNMKVKVAKALEEAEALQVVPLTAEEIEEKERLEKEKQEL